MYSFARSTGIIAILYFVSFNIIGVMILLNVFLAILLKNFDSSSIVEKMEINQESTLVMLGRKI